MDYKPITDVEFGQLRKGDSVRRIADSHRHGIRNLHPYIITRASHTEFTVMSDSGTTFTVSREKAYCWSLISSPSIICAPSPNKEQENMAKIEKAPLLPYELVVTNTKTGKIILNTTVTSRVVPDRETTLVDLAVQGKIKSAKNLRTSIRPL